MNVLPPYTLCIFKNNLAWCVCSCVCVCVCVFSHGRTQTHTETHTYKHAHAHTNTHTHTRMHARMRSHNHDMRTLSLPTRTHDRWCGCSLWRAPKPSAKTKKKKAPWILLSLHCSVAALSLRPTAALSASFLSTQSLDMFAPSWPRYLVYVNSNTPVCTHEWTHLHVYVCLRARTWTANHAQKHMDWSGVSSRQASMCVLCV